MWQGINLNEMFLNQVKAPITMLLLQFTLCVQESDTKLFKLISHYTNKFVLKAVQGFFFFLTNYKAILPLSFPPNRLTAQGLPVSNEEETPTELVDQM